MSFDMNSSSFIVLALIFTKGSSLALPQSRSTNFNTPSPDLCHPTPASMEHVYVVGYGSLLNTKSKGGTNSKTGLNIPVNIKGFKRRWNCEGSPIGLSTTYLGVEQEANSSLNGVIFRLPDIQSLWDFDRRERYYCRREVNISQIEFLINENYNSTVKEQFPGEGAQFWIYTVKPEFKGWPTKRYPIVQSYVDIFLAGCLEMEQTYNLTGFSDECMNETEGWNFPWVNDRITPRRAFANTPNAHRIDILIEKHLPNHFSNVKIEQEIWYNVRNNGRKEMALWLGFYIIFGFTLWGWS